MSDNDINGLLVLVSLISLATCAVFGAPLFGLHDGLICVAVIVVGSASLAMLGDAMSRAPYRSPRKTSSTLPSSRTAGPR